MKAGFSIWLKNMRPIVQIFAAATVLGIILYWAAVFGGFFSVELLVPGYVDWFMAFPAADAWIAICAALSVFFQKRNPLLSAVLLSAAGSGLIFLGLYAFAYGYRTGLLLHLTGNEVLERAIKIYCLAAGGLFLCGSYRDLTRLRSSRPSGVRARQRL